jgi:uncharacterized protein (TIGR02145 family)
MKKAPLNPLFFCALMFAAPVFANFTRADSAKAIAHCQGGSFKGTTIFVENQSEATARAKAEIASNIISQVEDQVNLSRSKEKGSDGKIEVSNSYTTTSQIKSSLELFGFQEIESPKLLENGLYEFKGYVCNSNMAKPYLNSFEKYLSELNVLKRQAQGIDEDVCISAREVRYKMLNLQIILEVLKQVDKSKQNEFEKIYGEIEKECEKIKYTQTIAVITSGIELKSNALKNLGKYVKEALASSDLYSVLEDEREAKFKCLVEISKSYQDNYMMDVKIVSASTGTIAKNRQVVVTSSLKTENEHKRASYEIVSKLLKHCGRMSVGETYEGECENGLKNGKGKLNYLDGSVYDGEWKVDKFHGKGKFIAPNGFFYEGDWKEDEFDGKGKVTYADSSVYEGEWKKGKYQGKGKLTATDSSVYEGEFKDGNFDGRGKRTYASGVVYEGEWKNGLAEGKGKLIYADGGVYEGEWKNDLQEGKGKLTYADDGGVYEGEFKNSQFSGKGKLIYANGGIYEGEFKNGMENGKGRIVATDGSVYEGEFKNGQSSGKGKLTRANGDVYEGEYKNGWENGKGKLTSANGDVYEGEFKAGNYEGKGKYISTYGLVYEGEFKAGQFNQGKLTYADGSVYEGDIGKNWYPHGKGKLTYKDGGTLEGEFREGTFYGKEGPKNIKSSSYKDTRDGKEYRTVEIGTQTWMAENLNYNASSSLCYNNDPANCQKYGRLYDWATAKTACPSGWHLPSREEWESLVNTVSNITTAGGRLKTGKGWDSYQGNPGNGSNDYDFSALPSGGYNVLEKTFSGMGTISAWWTSIERDNNNAHISITTNQSATLATMLELPKLNGLSVRCLKGPAPYVAPPEYTQPAPEYIPPTSDPAPTYKPDYSSTSTPGIGKNPVLYYVLGSLALAGSGVLFYYGNKQLNDKYDKYNSLNSGIEEEYDKAWKEAKDARDTRGSLYSAGSILGGAGGMFLVAGFGGEHNDYEVKTRFGLRFALPIINVDYGAGEEPDFGLGAQLISFVLSIPLSDRITIEPEIDLLNYRFYWNDWAKYEEYAISVPLTLRYVTTPPPHWGLYAEGGVHLDFALSTNFTEFEDEEIDEQMDDRATFGFGFVFGGGVSFNVGSTVTLLGYRYVKNLTSFLKYEGEGYGKLSQHQITLGLLF